MNAAILIGNLGAEPEVKTFENGNQIARLSLATNETYKDAQGERQKVTEWHNVIVAGKMAEVAGKYLEKGSKISIQGRLKTRSWEQDGQKKYITEIHCRGFNFEDSKGTNQKEPAQKSEKQYKQPEQSENLTSDEDLPF